MNWHIVYITSIIYYIVVVIVSGCLNVYMYRLTEQKDWKFMVTHFIYMTFFKAPLVAPFYVAREIFKHL